MILGAFPKASREAQGRFSENSKEIPEDLWGVSWGHMRTQGCLRQSQSRLKWFKRLPRDLRGAVWISEVFQGSQREFWRVSWGVLGAQMRTQGRVREPQGHFSCFRGVP